MTETGSSQENPSFLYPPFRSKSRVITGGQWNLKWTLDVNGQQIDAGELHYSDTFLANSPAELGRLVVCHLDQQASLRLKKGKR